MPRRGGTKFFVNPTSYQPPKDPDWLVAVKQQQAEQAKLAEEKRKEAEAAQGRAAEAARQAAQTQTEANAAALNEKAMQPRYLVNPTPAGRFFGFRGGRTSKIGRKFDRCVKAVRKTVRARNKESAAIAICTKSVLQTRGRTLKRYKKGRLTTQRKFRGGTKEALTQIAADLDNQTPAITNAFGTGNLKMEYTPTVGPEVIAAALAVVPTAEAPSGFFGRFRKVFSSKPPEEKVREFLEEVSKTNSYTFSSIGEPESMSNHLRALAGKLSQQ